ncbi:hypothetical protein [Spirosoma sp. KNUC1025]|uniref:hypothetical protein n=1 Tax=Spirosoma sp. KNUC1025 TaxID=2894082 RepID=UPI0038679AD8|nr:hypothetical protein LN737_05205 [Spirosoma sp. KNUC1025]
MVLGAGLAAIEGHHHVAGRHLPGPQLDLVAVVEGIIRGGQGGGGQGGLTAPEGVVGPVEARQGLAGELLGLAHGGAVGASQRAVGVELGGGSFGFGGDGDAGEPQQAIVDQFDQFDGGGGGVGEGSVGAAVAQGGHPFQNTKLIQILIRYSGSPVFDQFPGAVGAPRDLL